MRRVLVWFTAAATLAAAGCGPAPAGSAPAAPVPAAEPPAPVPPATYRVGVLVRDFAGAPVAGARVVAVPPQPRASRAFGRFMVWPGTEPDSDEAVHRSLPPGWDLVPRAEARTGDDGRCTLTGLAAGRWIAVVDSPGRVQRRALAVTGPESPAPDVEIRAERGHALAGRVLSGDGRPIAEAVVLASYPPVSPAGDLPSAVGDFALVRTGDDGAYRFDALPATTVSVRSAPPGGWSDHEWPVLIPAVASLDLRTTARGPVEGVVRSEKGGAPVAGAAITFSVGGWHTANVSARATTDAEGRYRLPLFPDDGIVQISVEAAGFHATPDVVGLPEPPFHLNDAGPSKIDLRLRPDTPESADVRVVVRGPDGPVAGAKVWLCAAGRSYYSSGTRTTDADGRAHFLDVPPERIAALVSSAHRFYQPGTKGIVGDEEPPPDPNAEWWIEADAPRPVDVEIAVVPGGKVSGRVVDESGAPVGGADVYARNGLATKSDADGRFLIEGTDEPEEDTIAARQKARKLAGDSAKRVYGAGRDATDVEIVVRARPAEDRPRILVKGRVTTGEPDVPLTDAVVACDDVWTPVGADGAFSLVTQVSASATDVAVEVSIPGFASGKCKVAIPHGAREVDAGEVTVPRTAAFRGSVTGAGGPVAGAAVTLGHPRTVIACGPSEDAQPLIVAVTGADGRFSVTGVPPDSYIAGTRPATYFEVEDRIDVRSGGEPSEWHPTLRHEAFLVGRLVREDGRGVQGAELTAKESNGAAERWRLKSHYGWTDARGGFRIRVPSGLTYVLEAKPERDDRFDFADDLVPRRAGIPWRDRVFRPFASEPLAADGRPVSFVVADGGTIAGRVVDASGEPVADALVTCERAEDEPGSASVESEEEDAGEDAPDEGPAVPWFEGRRTRTGDDGAFELLGLPEGAFDLAVHAALDAPVDVKHVAAGARDVVVKLPKRRTIEGVLLGEDGKPAPHRKLEATRVGGGVEAGVPPVLAATDAEGRFRLMGTGAEACSIALSSGRRYRTTSPLVGGNSVRSGAKDVVLRIPGRAATTISGRVVDSAGKPFPAFELRVHTPHANTIHSGDAAGTEFDYDDLDPDAPTRMEFVCAGLAWELSVPAGTHDLVVTAGADGVERVRFGGRDATELRVTAKLQREDSEWMQPSAVRLVHVRSGEIRSWTTELEPVSLPVGPWAVEVRASEDSDWQRCRPGREEKPFGDPVLFWKE